MASTRKTHRSRSSGEHQQSHHSSAESPVSKRKKLNSPNVSHILAAPSHILQSESPSNVDSDEVEDVEIEEEVVTVDVTACSEDIVEEETVFDDTSVTGEPMLVSAATEKSCETAGGTEQQGAGDETADAEKPAAVFVFKDPNFVHSNKGASGSKRTRVWKNLKQIVAAERVLPWGPEDTTYGSIDAPPSFKPAKKYSDISGLESRYTDPQTKMRYTNADEYRRIRLLPGDIITGCLALRKANALVP